MEKHNNHKERINKIKHTTDKTAEDTFDVLQKDQVNKIEHLAKILFNTNDWLSNFCFYTDDPADCSDGSDMYTIAKVNWKNTAIKVWAGEFNIEVFNQKKINNHNKYNSNSFKDYKYIKWFSKTPIPLFIINQVDSHFANEEQKELKENNPKEYLQKYSAIVVPKKKQAYINDLNNINFNDINIQNDETIIKNLQSTIINTKFTKKELWEIKHTIKDWQAKELNEFKWTINYYKKNGIKDKLTKKLLELIEYIVQDKNNINKMYDFIKSYDLKNI